MTETKKLWDENDELAYQMGNMDGILYQDENRELATEKSILQVKGLTNNKEDSNDRPDIPTPAVPFWVNIKR